MNYDVRSASRSDPPPYSHLIGKTATARLLREDGSVHMTLTGTLITVGTVNLDDGKTAEYVEFKGDNRLATGDQPGSYLQLVGRGTEDQ